MPSPALTLNNVVAPCLYLFYSWEGKGEQEVGKDKDTGKVLVRVNPRFYRPTEVVSFSIRLNCTRAVSHPHSYC